MANSKVHSVVESLETYQLMNSTSDNHLTCGNNIISGKQSIIKSGATYFLMKIDSGQVTIIRHEEMKVANSKVHSIVKSESTYNLMKIDSAQVTII